VTACFRQDQIDERLGVGAGNKRRWSNPQAQSVKLRLTQNAGDRLALSSSFQMVGKFLICKVGHYIAASSNQRRLIETGGIGEEQARVEARCVAARASEHSSRLCKNLSVCHRVSASNSESLRA
jgi:hypothetical protein